MKSGHRYFAIHKPVNMVSQFISSHKVGLLGDLDFSFPPETHAIGRLDQHSEGLLLLSTNKKVTRLLFLGDQPHQRVYLVMINNEISEEHLELLQGGVSIRVKGGGMYVTPATTVRIVKDPEKEFGIITDNNNRGTHTWLLIILTEGKFRQVRKMVAAVKHRCKRLIRISIEDIQLGKMKPGEVVELTEQDFFRKLSIVYP